MTELKVTGSTYGITTNSWAIRGVTTNDWSSGSEPSVAVYIDEAYIGRNSFATSSFFDIASLEVLRGPQGTLFGRNSAAGAITLQTNKPAMEDSLQLGLGVGNEKQYDYNLVGNASLSDSFAMRLAYHGTRLEGVWEDVENSEDLYRDEDAVRLSALWAINDRLDAFLSLNYGDQEFNGNAPYNPGISTVKPGQEFPDDVAWERPNKEKNETWGATLRLDWELSDAMTFTSISDARKADYFYDGDQDGSNNGAAVDAAVAAAIGASTITGGVSLEFKQDDTEYETFSQEFRLSGSSRVLEWFAGVHYFTEDSQENQFGTLRNTVDLSSIGLPPGAVLAQDSNELRGDNESLGIYADLSWSVSDALRVSAGARYTEDEKDFCTKGASQLEFISVTTMGQICEKLNWDELTPRLVVDYSLSESAMLYGSIARGYKAGGTNPAAVDTVGDGFGDTVASFDPEKNTSYEIGLKSEWMDSRLRFNVAAFYSDYEDIQVQTATAGGILIDNAAAANINGGEIELTFAATDHLTLSANYAYLDAEYDDSAEFDGNKLIYAPEHTYNVDFRYSTPVVTGQVVLFGAYSWQSKMYYDPINARVPEEPSYGLLRSRLAYESGSGRWDVALSGDNLLNDDCSGCRGDIDLGLGPQLARGLPRLYKFSVNLYF